MGRPLKSLAGRRFGCLTVVERVMPPRPTMWRCRCECGREHFASSGALNRGTYSKCYCDRPDHGLSSTPEYRIWRGIICRCENPRVSSFESYGGRGVSVAPEWRHDFPAFLAYLGPRPSPRHSVDRIDVNGDYAPGNVRWASLLVQANNKRATRRVLYRGQLLPLCDAVRLAGSVIHHEAAWVRIRSGWAVDRALETPRLHLSGNSRELRA